MKKLFLIFCFMAISLVALNSCSFFAYSEPREELVYTPNCTKESAKHYVDEILKLNGINPENFEIIIDENESYVMLQYLSKNKNILGGGGGKFYVFKGTCTIIKGESYQ